MSATTKNTGIYVRVDEETKSSAEEVCSEIGLSVSSAINIFLKRLVRDRQIPFKLSAIQKPPALDDYTNEELLASLEESRQQYLRGEYYTEEEIWEHLDSLDRKYGIQN